MSWKTLVARYLDGSSYSLFDERKELLDSLRIEVRALQVELAQSQIKSGELFDDLMKLESKYNTLKTNSHRADLSQFKTNRTYKINGVNRKLNTWFTIPAEQNAVHDWRVANIDVSKLTGSIDDKGIQLRELVDDYFGNKDIWKADKIQNTFSLPSELIETKFTQVNCNDMFTFLMYLYEDVFGDQNKLYGVIGGLNLPVGYNQGNHAYCLWRHNDGKYYVIESAVGRTSPWNRYVRDSISLFGKLDHTKNFRYSRIVWMSNATDNFYQVIL